MKFDAEEIKKAILSGIMVLIVLYCYKNLMLDDLNRRETNANGIIASLKPQLDKAKEQINRTQSLIDSAPADTQVLEQIKALIPPGEPITWFPPRIVEFFKRQGLDKIPPPRKGNESLDPSLPGFKKIAWSIELPKTEFVQLGIAIAGLENEEPLLEITGVQIDESNDNLQFQHASMSISTIVKDDKR